MLRHGFFHADPHPGNVSVDASGRLLFYDFGMMGQIVPNVRERLLDLFYGIYKYVAGYKVQEPRAEQSYPASAFAPFACRISRNTRHTSARTPLLFVCVQERQ